MTIKVDLNTPIVCERDCFHGETYCFECFSPPKGNVRGSLYFYNGHGPFCSKECFANYVAIDIDQLPKLLIKGSIKGT